MAHRRLIEEKKEGNNAQASSTKHSTYNILLRISEIIHINRDNWCLVLHVIVSECRDRCIEQWTERFPIGHIWISLIAVPQASALFTVRWISSGPSTSTAPIPLYTYCMERLSLQVLFPGNMDLRFHMPAIVIWRNHGPVLRPRNYCRSWNAKLVGYLRPRQCWYTD